MENYLKVLEFDNAQLANAVFAERNKLTPREVETMCLSDINVLGWWLQQGASTPEFRAAQKAMNELVLKVATMVETDRDLKPDEAKDLENFLKMLAIQRGIVSKKERLNRSFHDYFPWIFFIKDWVLGHSYLIFFLTWAFIFLNALGLGIKFEAWPIFLTFLIPLVISAVFLLGIASKDGAFKDDRDKWRLNSRVRLACLTPVILGLWCVYFLISSMGQLAIGLTHEPQLIVSRNSDIQAVITVADRFPRYPSLVEAIIDGDHIVAPPALTLTELKTYPVSDLYSGQLVIEIKTEFTTPVAYLSRQNYQALERERKSLADQANTMAQSWAAGYRVNQDNGQLSTDLNKLKSDNFRVIASPGKLTWVTETIVPKEKEVDKTTTTTTTVTTKEKVTEEEKHVVPKEIWVH
jgi:hypothetical protein